MEGDTFCAIQWDSGLCLAPWSMPNSAEEVIDLR